MLSSRHRSGMRYIRGFRRSVRSSIAAALMVEETGAIWHYHIRGRDGRRIAEVFSGSRAARGREDTSADLSAGG